MNKEIVQKDRFELLKLTIDDTGLLYYKKTHRKEVELHFTFEQIKTTRVTEWTDNKLLLVLTGLSALIALICWGISSTDPTISISTILFWVLLTAVFGAFYLGLRDKVTYLYTTEGKIIALNARKPSKIHVEEFIETLFSERNQYLISRYGNPNRNIDYAPQFDNLNWLLTTKAMSKALYDEKVRDLNALFNVSVGNSKIGFAK